MNTISEIGAVVAEIERARQLVQELRGKSSPGEISAIAGQLDEALSAAASNAANAAKQFGNLTQRLNELSSVVVGSTARHF